MACGFYKFYGAICVESMQQSTDSPVPLILVTGAGGALGRALLIRLRNAGFRVRALVLPGFTADGAHEVVEGDVRDATSLLKATQGVQAVLHMAGIILSRSEGDFFLTNTLGTHNMIQASLEQGVERFIFVSSTSVEYEPRTAYAESKWQAEQFVRESSLHWSIVRPTLLVGKGGGVEFKMFCKLARLPFVPLPQGGVALKKPVHVDDLAQGLCQLLQAPAQRTHAIYSLAGLESISLADMLCAIATQNFSSSENGRPVKTIIAVPVLLCSLLASILDKLPLFRFSAAQGLEGLLQQATPSIESAERDFGYSPKILTGRWHT